MRHGTALDRRSLIRRMRPELQVVPGPPPTMTSGNAGHGKWRPLGGACWTKNTYLVTVPGHPPRIPQPYLGARVLARWPDGPAAHCPWRAGGAGLRGRGSGDASPSG